MFRRIDGVCNNLANKHWGASGTPFIRLAPVAYADGLFQPRAGSGFLPSPREVSEALHAAELSGSPSPGPLTVKGVTHLVMQWGQFLDHDITITPEAGFVPVQRNLSFNL